MRKLMQSLEVSLENYGLLKIIYFAFFANGFVTVMLGTLLPYIRSENSLTYAQSGLVISAQQCGNLCAVLVAGILPYMIGRKKSTVIMGSGACVGLVLMTLTRNPWLLAAAFAFTGIGRGTMSNICNTVVSDVSGNKTGGLNMMHAAYAVGALISPVLLYSFTRPADSGWKLAAAVGALLSFAALVMIARSGLSNTPGEKESGGSFSFLKNISFWLNTMILFFYLCAEASIVGWFVMYFKDTGILPPGVAEFTPSMLWLMIMIGRLSCAAVSARVDKNRLLLLLSLCFTFCFAGMLVSKSAVVCVIFLLGIGLSMAGIFPTTFSTMQGTSSTLSSGFLIAIASLGGIIMPGIIGAVADVHGLEGGVALVLAALGGIVILAATKVVLAKYGR